MLMELIRIACGMEFPLAYKILTFIIKVRTGSNSDFTLRSPVYPFK